MKTKTLLLMLFVLTGICSCNKKDESKDNQRVLAIYYLEGMCKDSLHSSPDSIVFPDECTVVIKESDKYGLLINIEKTSADFKAFLRGDSLFIPHQQWCNFDGNQATFQGKGKMTDDSLFLHYGVGGRFGVFDCECKGGKITE